MKAKLLAMGLALIIFAAGVVGGVVLDRRWLADDTAAITDRRPGPGRQLERFRSRLALDDRQAAAIDAILTNARADAAAVRERSQEQILALLTPDQAARYRAMIERSQKRRHNRGDRDRARPGR